MHSQPLRFQAGDTFQWRRTLPQFLAAEGWEVRLRLVPRQAAEGAAPVQIVGAADGAEWLLAAAPSVTQGWHAGDYGWVIWAQGGPDGEVRTVELGELAVLPDPRTLPAGADTRSAFRRALDDALQALTQWTPTRRRYRIGDREMEFGSLADIKDHIAFLRNEVRREELAAAGNPFGRRVFVRLGRA